MSSETLFRGLSANGQSLPGTVAPSASPDPPPLALNHEPTAPAALTAPSLIRFAATVDTSLVRAADMDGAPHLVVPIVACKAPMALHAQGAPTPELVTVRALSADTQAWDSKPIVSMHPNGGSSSACTPEMSGLSFGRMFNTTFSDGMLRTEGWIDIAKATSMGGDAAEVMRRAQAGEEIEVSIGCYVRSDPDSRGMLDGVEYTGEWLSLSPDHLAMLPVGVKGACSNDTGCGAPRLSVEGNVSAPTCACNGSPTASTLPTTAQSPDSPGLIRRLYNAALNLPSRPRFAGVGDEAIHAALFTALERIVPGIWWIEDVFQVEGWVMYSTWFDEFQIFRRSYTETDGVVTIGDDAVQVTRTRAPDQYIPVSETTTILTGEPTMNRSEQATALIAEAVNPFTETEILAMSDTRVAEMHGRFCVSETVPAPVVPTLATAPTPVAPAPTTPATPTVPAIAPAPTGHTLTAPQYARFLTLDAAATEAATLRVGTLVNGIRAATDVYTEEQLTAMLLPDLESLGRVCRVPAVNYTGQNGTPLVSTPKAPVDPYAARLEARRAN